MKKNSHNQDSCSARAEKYFSTFNGIVYITLEAYADILEDIINKHARSLVVALENNVDKKPVQFLVDKFNEAINEEAGEYLREVRNRFMP